MKCKGCGKEFSTYPSTICYCTECMNKRNYKPEDESEFMDSCNMLNDFLDYLEDCRESEEAMECELDFLEEE